MTVVYRLPTGWYPKWSSDQRDAAHAWLEAHGIDYTLVPIDTDVAITIDRAPSGARWLEVPTHVRGDSGRLLIDQATNAPARTRTRVPLAQDPPAVLDQWATRNEPR